VEPGNENVWETSLRGGGRVSLWAQVNSAANISKEAKLAPQRLTQGLSDIFSL
jgi:hypothetical protein